MLTRKIVVDNIVMLVLIVDFGDTFDIFDTKFFFSNIDQFDIPKMSSTSEDCRHYYCWDVIGDDIDDNPRI